MGERERSFYEETSNKSLLSVDEDIVEFYRKRGRLGYARITIHSLQWKRQLYGTRSSSDGREDVYQLKIFPAKASRTTSSSSSHKRCKTIKAEDLLMNNGEQLYINNIEGGKGSFSFEWKTWVNCQFQLLLVLPSSNTPNNNNNTNNTPTTTSHPHSSATVASSSSAYLPSSASSVTTQRNNWRRQRFLLSDAITVTSSSQQERHLLFAKSYDLLDATVILSIEFYPNDVSFPFICITSERSQSDYSYLLNTLERLKRSSMKKVKEKGKSKGRVDVELFLLSIQYLKERIEQSEQLLHSLLPSRESKILVMASANQLKTSSSSATSSPLRHYDVVMQNKLNRATTALTRQTFESHVVANAAKTFLSELQKNLTYVSH